MKVTGLKHQWGDRLLAQFIAEPGAPERYHKRALAIHELLTYLETIEGPDLWVGTSLSTLNFCARDTRDKNERVPSLAFVEVVDVDDRDGALYRIEYPLPREVRPWFERLPEKENVWYEPRENLWDEAMVRVYAQGVESAGSMLLTAITSSDANPSRLRSNWLWYICPTCDFHSPHFNTHCERCGFTFPSKEKTESIGLYRKVQFPKGT